MKSKAIISAQKGITPPAIIISTGYFFIELFQYLSISIPDNLILSGITLLYGLGIALQHFFNKEK